MGVETKRLVWMVIFVPYFDYLFIFYFFLISYLDFSRFLSYFRNVNAFLEFAKSGEDGDYRVVHRTEVVRWSTSPRWKRFAIPMRSLCGGDLDRDIKITCYDYHTSGTHTLIGTVVYIFGVG